MFCELPFASLTDYVSLFLCLYINLKESDRIQNNRQKSIKIKRKDLSYFELASGNLYPFLKTFKQAVTTAGSNNTPLSFLI